MKANQIRIGNHLKYRSEEDGKWRSIKITSIDIVICERNAELFNEARKPIKLNETILVRSGFPRSPNGHFCIQIGPGLLELSPRSGGYLPAYKTEPLTTEEQTVFLHRLWYVHEFENLYFVLTGREISLDLTILEVF